MQVSCEVSLKLSIRVGGEVPRIPQELLTTANHDKKMEVRRNNRLNLAEAEVYYVAVTGNQE